MAARPKPGQVEERTAPELEVDGRKIRGVVPFGVESRDMGSWTEIIEPTALRGARLDDLVANVDHGGVPIGRFPTTLEIEERADGMHWAVTPPESRADLLEAIERRDLKAGSWRMRVSKDRWVGDVRHVEQIAELLDVSVVSHPSYPQAEVELRSTNNDNNAAQARQGEEMDQPEQQEPQVEQHDDESRALPAGSLRVEERHEVQPFQSLADLYTDRGFFENRTAAVTWDEWRSFSWAAGTVVSDINPIRRDGVPLGFDQRWLYPALPTTAVDAATTSVQYLRESSRSLAGTAVLRALDSVAQKPETSTTVELKTEQLSQVATVSSGIPRIHAAQPMFQSLIEQDLRLAVSDGLDELVRRGVTTAGTAAAVTGNVLDKIRKAKTVVAGQGYNPDVLAIDPAGAETLDLLKTSGSEAMYVFNAGAAAPAPYGLQVRVWKSAGTALLDADAFGRLYVAPMELRSFEADGGLSNTQNVRLETNAAFTVERVSAGLKIL
jgi:phage head maturation protease